MNYDIVIHNGTILTVNPSFDIIEDGVVGIRQDRLELVASKTDAHPLPRAAKIIDAAGGIIMPGLVNTHTHLPMSLFRGLADDLALDIWLNKHIFPAEAQHLNPQTVRWGTLLAAAEMLLAGTTCCCDGYFLEDMVAATLAETGMRAVVGQGVIDFPAPGVADPADNIAAASRFLHARLNASALVTPSVFCHSPYTCSKSTLQQAKALAEKTGVLFQIHAAETRPEFDRIQAAHGTTPVGYLDSLGLLDSGTLLVHCTWLTEEDIEMIARHGARVAHCPESNMKLAAGIAPVPALLAAGVTVGLGSDGCASNNDLNLFHEMGTAARLHKAVSGQPTVMDAAAVVKMATIEGAAAIGLDGKTGSLETGKQADVIVVNTRRPHMTPMYHPESHVVYAAGAADVSHVMVAGKLLVAGGRLTGMDLDEILARVNQIAFKIRKGAAP